MLLCRITIFTSLFVFVFCRPYLKETLNSNQKAEDFVEISKTFIEDLFEDEIKNGEDEQMSLNAIRKRLTRSINGLQKLINETEASIKKANRKDERWELNEYRLQMLDLFTLKSKVLEKIGHLFYNIVELDPPLDESMSNSVEEVYLHHPDEQLLERPQILEVQLLNSEEN